MEEELEKVESSMRVGLSVFVGYPLPSWQRPWRLDETPRPAPTRLATAYGRALDALPLVSPDSTTW